MHHFNDKCLKVLKKILIEMVQENVYQEAGQPTDDSAPPAWKQPQIGKFFAPNGAAILQDIKLLD